MAPTTRTTPKPKTTPAPRRAGASRARPVAAPVSRRTPSIPRRRKPEPESNAKKVLGAVTTALPGLIEKAGAPAKKAKPSSKKGSAGLAILGAGAGFAALRKSGKLPGRLGGQSSSAQAVPVTPVATPVTPVATTPVTVEGPQDGANGAPLG